jgi:peptidoglycan-N-acetylglucosamine deacetylase
MSRLLPIRRPPSRRVSRPPSPATFSDALRRNWRGEFAAQYKRGRYFHMTLHPQHIGWSNRLQMLDEFLAELRGYPSLWNPTAAEYARYWLKTYPAGTHLRLEPNIWHDYPGSLS